jgi:hypothetical protein
MLRTRWERLQADEAEALLEQEAAGAEGGDLSGALLFSMLLHLRGCSGFS